MLCLILTFYHYIVKLFDVESAVFLTTNNKGASGMAEPSDLLNPTSAIVVSLIAGLFSFFNLVIAKEQKLSELRQSWIDGLREELATFFAAIYTLEYLTKAYCNNVVIEDIDRIDLAKTTHEPHIKACTAFTQIMLRLNPADKNEAQTKLIEKLNKIRDSFNKDEYHIAIQHIEEARTNAQLVLKTEWERVKRGEKTFYLSKYAALTILLSTLVLGGYLAIQTSNHSSNSTIEKSLDPTKKPIDKESSTIKGITPKM